MTHHYDSSLGGDDHDDNDVCHALISTPLALIASSATSMYADVRALRFDDVIILHRPAYGEKLHPKVQTMRSFWLCSYAFHITAWMSATLFHMRDLWLTERMDYFSACAAVTFSVTGCICMFFDFEHVKLIVVAWFVPYCIHIHYLATAPRFDYVRTSEINTFANVFVCLRVHVHVCMSVCDREEDAEGCACVCVCPFTFSFLFLHRVMQLQCGNPRTQSHIHCGFVQSLHLSIYIYIYIYICVCIRC